MESTSSATTVGVGVALQTQLSNSASSTYEICRYVSPRKRGCTMLASADSPTGLCNYHSRRQAAELQRLQSPEGEIALSDETASKLLRSVNGFATAEDVSRFLGNVVKQMVCGQVSRRDAIALGYLGQLVLNSISVANTEYAREEAREAARKAEHRRLHPPRIVWKDGCAYGVRDYAENPDAAE